MKILRYVLMVALPLLVIGAGAYGAKKLIDSRQEPEKAPPVVEPPLVRVIEAQPRSVRLTVETEGWEDRKDGSVKIDQIIYVARDGHKGIVLGKKGETVKAVGQLARADLEEFLGRKVHLFLQVKVRPGWLEEAERYSAMGLDFSDGKQG